MGLNAISKKKILFLGIGFGVTIPLIGIYYFFVRKKPIKKIQEIKTDTQNPSNLSCKIIIVSIEEIQNVSDVLDEILITMLPQIKKLKKAINDMRQSSEADLDLDEIKEEITKIFMETEEKILSQTSYTTQQWYSVLKLMENVPEIRSRQQLFQEYMNSTLESKEISIEFSLPKEFTFNSYLRILRKILLYRLCKFQEIYGDIKNNFAMMSGIERDNINQAVNKESIEKSQSIIRKLNFTNISERGYQTVFERANYNYSKDSNNKKICEFDGRIYQYIKKMIFEGTQFPDLKNDPFENANSDKDWDKLNEIYREHMKFSANSPESQKGSSPGSLTDLSI